MDLSDKLEQTQRASAGDVLALTMLLKDSRRELCARLDRKTPADLRGLLDADDLVQDTHIEVFRSIAGFKPRGPDSFDRWVRCIAVRKLRDAIRWHRAAKRGGGAAPAGTGFDPQRSTVALLDLIAGPTRTPSRDAASIEALRAVQTAMERLPADHQLAVRMVYVEGRSVAAAAAALGRSERAIHGLCRRGLERLRAELDSRSRFLSSTG